MHIFGLLLRLTWMLIGNAAILILFMMIAFDSDGALSWRDGAIGAAAIAIVAARWLDVAKYRGDTAEGTPATMTDVKRHALMVLVATPILAALAHWIAQ